MDDSYSFEVDPNIENIDRKNNQNHKRQKIFPATIGLETLFFQVSMKRLNI